MENAASRVALSVCYYLIRHDLPCMDNDDPQRGRHVHGFLANGGGPRGDALLTQAFEILATFERDVTSQDFLLELASPPAQKLIGAGD
jgi:hypothetical protein